MEAGGPTRGAARRLSNCGLWLASGRQSLAGLDSLTAGQRLAVAHWPHAGALNSPRQNSPPSSCPHFFVHVVNSCWLALPHLAHTSPKIFVFLYLLIYRSKNYEICTYAKLIPRYMFTKSFKTCKKK
jgi:hypothetical protein